MERSLLMAVYLLGVSLCVCRAAKPLGGRFAGEDAITQTLYLDKEAKEETIQPSVSCRALSLYKDASIRLKVKVLDSSSHDKSIHVTMSVTVIKSRCANFRDCKLVRDSGIFPGYMRNMSSYLFTNTEVSTKPEILIGPVSNKAGRPVKNPVDKRASKEDDVTKATAPPAPAPAPAPAPTPTPTPTAPATAPAPAPATAPAPAPSDTSGTLADRRNKTNESGLYIVYIETWIHERGVNATLKLDLQLKNTYGYLSAIDYPSLVFYGLMMAVYAILGLAWSISMCCAYKDLVRLQFWVFAVIILGFLEKIFFVSEYSSINAGEQSSLQIVLAETVSAVKRALARVLLIIVCLGFGTVKPRLGDSLMKVIAMGVIYCILAFIDGVVRARADTYDTGDRSQIVTLGLLFAVDSIVLYWAFTSLVAVRRALRLRKNYVKLAMYNHFAYTLIFSLLATAAFTVWVFVKVNFPRDSCLEDWQEVWLRDCFWHFLFCVILVVIMIIWRPSANRNRFAYSLVNDLDQEEEVQESMENKNFETLKMRTVSRGDAGTPPPVSSTQAEDDLRWVEENLPTTAMDKALPLILDSDEEVMSTKFEASKLN